MGLVANRASRNLRVTACAPNGTGTTGTAGGTTALGVAERADYDGSGGSAPRARRSRV